MLNEAIKKYAKKNDLVDINVVELGLVDKGAVKDGNFRIIKSTDGSGSLEFKHQFLIQKSDAVTKRVYGYALVPGVVDSQGDEVSAEEIEKAQIGFMANLSAGAQTGTGISKQHQVFSGQGYLIESAIDIAGSLAEAHGVEGIAKAWWVGVQVTNDELWTDIEKGDITGFSIGGTGKPIPVEKLDESAILKTLEHMTCLVKSFIGINKSDDFNSILAAREKGESIFFLTDTLISALFVAFDDDSVKDKSKAIAKNIDQFKAAFLDFVTRSTSTTDVTKQLSTLKNTFEIIKSQGNETVVQGKDHTMSDIDKLLKSVEAVSKTLGGINARLEKLESPEGDPKEPVKKDGQDGNGDPTPAPDESMEKLTKAIDGIGTTIQKMDDRLTLIETTPKVRKGDSSPDPNAGGESTDVVKAGQLVDTPFSFRKSG